MQTHKHTHTHTHFQKHTVSNHLSPVSPGRVGSGHMHRLPATDSERQSALRRKGKQTPNKHTHRARERERERASGVFQQPWGGSSESERSTSLVMVLVTEGGVAEEARAALGGAGGEGHRLQHCW